MVLRTRLGGREVGGNAGAGGDFVENCKMIFCLIPKLHAI